MWPRWALIILGTVLLTVGCASASDTVGTGSGDVTTTSSTAVTPPTTAPARTVQSFTSPADRQVPGGPTSTTTTPVGALQSFCRSARPFTKKDLDSITQFDTPHAGRLVLRFASLEKIAPADIAPAIGDMRPLVTELDQRVKAGTVHDLASFQSWIASMRASGSPTLTRWTAAQARLVTFVQAQCP